MGHGTREKVRKPVIDQFLNVEYVNERNTRSLIRKRRAINPAIYRVFGTKNIAKMTFRIIL